MLPLCMWKIWLRGFLVIVLKQRERFFFFSLPLTPKFKWIFHAMTFLLLLMPVLKNQTENDSTMAVVMFSIQNTRPQVISFTVWLLQSEINGLPSFEREKLYWDTRIYFLEVFLCSLHDTHYYFLFIFFFDTCVYIGRLLIHWFLMREKKYKPNISNPNCERLIFQHSMHSTHIV